jgi:hypothetical protein
MTQRTYMTDILHSFYWSFDYATLILSRNFFQIQDCQSKAILYNMVKIFAKENKQNQHAECNILREILYASYTYI